MGDELEFAAFVDHRWDRLVRAAVLMGCSLPEAEDRVQDALIRTLVHWDKVTGASNPEAYVYRILTNTITSARRRRWAREHVVADVPEQTLEDDFEAVDQTDAVMRALRLLPPDQRVAVVLRYYLHLTEAQMADTLDVPIGTVKSRLSRALHALADNDQLTELRGTP